MAEHLGYTSNGNEVMVATYALQRHARGEEEGAERTWLGQEAEATCCAWSPRSNGYGVRPYPQQSTRGQSSTE
jgi:hypothetical protein